MTNIIEILKNCPEGTKIYSTIFGEATFKIINDSIKVVVSAYDLLWFDKYGRYTPTGECLIFPSKDNRDWNTFNAPCQFKPFDKIVGRFSNGFWNADLFSYYKPGNEDGLPFHGISGYYYQCLPYNEETAKLIGTKDEYTG